MVLLREFARVGVIWESRSLNHHPSNSLSEIVDGNGQKLSAPGLEIVDDNGPVPDGAQVNCIRFDIFSQM